MRRVLAVSLLGLILASGTTEAAVKAEKAVCAVCVVTRGETEPEPVEASRAHEGVEYRFCSEECAKAFAAEPAAYLPPTFPRPAPAFSLAGLDGAPIRSEELAGKVVLVDFWATWCAPCIKAMPGLQRLHEKLAPRGFRVIGISIDEGGADAVRRSVAKKITYPIAMDSKEAPAWEAFRVKVVPSAYLVDRSGKIVAQWTGKAADPEEIEAKAEKLLDAAPR